MEAKEFEGFNLTLQEHISEITSQNARFHSCLISENTTLLGRENEIVRNAVPQREREFSAGRKCARECLASLGVKDFEILRGNLGEPLWPEGLTGSITHHAGMAFSVSVSNKWGFIGIDIADLTDTLTEPDSILNGSELGISLGCSNDKTGLILFSMKESVIKILSPLLKKYIEFKDIRITVSDQVAKASTTEIDSTIELFLVRYGRYAFTTAILKNGLNMET